MADYSSITKDLLKGNDLSKSNSTLGNYSDVTQSLLGSNKKNVVGYSGVTDQLLGKINTPDVSVQPSDAPKLIPGPSIGGEFVTGFKQGISSLKPTLNTLEGLTGKVVGADQFAQRKMAEAQQQTQALNKQYPVNVKWSDVNSLPTFLHFAARNLGEQVPTLALMVAGGGIGTLAGKLIVSGALTTAEALTAAEVYGTTAGTIGALGGLETAATGQEIYNATGKIDPGISVAAGLAKAALGSFVPLAFMSKFGIGKTAVGGIIDRALRVLDKVPTLAGKIAVGAGAAGVVGGATGLIQSAIDVGVRGYVDDNYDVLGKAARERLLSNAVVGALTDAVMGGVGAGLGRHGGGDTSRTGANSGDTGASPKMLDHPTTPNENGPTGLVTVPPAEPSINGTIPELGLGSNKGEVSIGEGVGNVAKGEAPKVVKPQTLPKNIQKLLPDLTGKQTDVQQGFQLVPQEVYKNVAGELSFTKGTGKDVVPLATEVKKPLVIGSDMELLQFLTDYKIKGSDIKRSDLATVVNTAEVRKRLKAKGFDGVIVNWNTKVKGNYNQDQKMVSVVKDYFGKPLVVKLGKVTTSGKTDNVSPIPIKIPSNSIMDYKRFTLDNLGSSLSEFKTKFNSPESFIKYLKNIKNVSLDPKVNKLKLYKAFMTQRKSGVMTKEIVKNLNSLGFYITTKDKSFDTTVNFGGRHVKQYSDYKGYDLSTHKKGTTGILHQKVESIKTKKSLENIKNIYNKLLKEFSLTEDKVLIRVGDNKKINGDIKIISKELSVITITDKTLHGSPEFLARTLIHEFGHLLVYRKFNSAPLEVRLKILKAFSRMQKKALFGDGKEFLLNYQAGLPNNLDNLFNITDAEFGNVKGNVNSSPEYYYNFQEFLAEQIVKYFTRNSELLSILDKFFKGIAEKIKTLYKRITEHFGIKEENLNPEKDIENWLNSLRSVKKAGKFIVENTKTDVNESNLKGDYRGPVNETVDYSIDASNLSKSEKDDIKAGVGRINWLIKWGYNIRQLSLINPNIRGLMRYNEFIDAWRRESISWKMKADETVKDAKNLGLDEQNNLDKFIFALDDMVYLKEGDQARLPTDKELVILAKKFNITKDALAIYNRMRKDLTDFISKVEEVSIRDVSMTVMDEVAQINAVAEIRAEFRNLKNRPYFPHTRFGDFAVVVKSLKTKKVLYAEQFKTHKQALSAWKVISKKYPEDSTKVTQIPKEVMPFQGLPKALLVRLKTMPGLSEDQKAWIDNFSVNLSSFKSFKKRLAQRENVPGYSLDSLRSYANYFWHGSNFLAKIEYKDLLQNEINSVRAQASDPFQTNGKDVTKLVQIADFMQNHMNEILNPGPDWAQLRSLTFMWMLGFIPKSAFTNLTQVSLVAYPHLSAMYGDGRTLFEFTKAYSNLRKRWGLKVNNTSDSFLQAFDHAVKQDVVTESQATMLAATSEGSNLARMLPGNTFDRMMASTAHWAAFLFQQSEQANRIVTFETAWNLADKAQRQGSKVLRDIINRNVFEIEELKKLGFSSEDAISYVAARDAVETTMFKYSTDARPRFMRGRKGVAFTFMSFTQGMLFFAMHDKGRIRFLLLMLLVGGIMGLPGAQDINDFVRYASRKLLGKDVNLEKDVRKFITDLSGNADLILHGISRDSFGMAAAGDAVGIPFPSIDLSGSIGMGSIIPGIRSLASPDESWSNRWSRVTTDMAGATVGTGIAIMQALADDQLPANDWKRWERAMPNILKNIGKSYNDLSTGKVLNNQGGTVLKFDMNDPKQVAEAIAQGLGFTPTRLSRTYDRNRMQSDAIKFWTIRRGMLLKQYDTAVQKGSRVAIGDVIAAVARFNNEVGNKGFTITNRQLRLSLRGREKRRAKFDQNLPMVNKHIQVNKDIQKLFPNLSEDVSKFK